MSRSLLLAVVMLLMAGGAVRGQTEEKKAPPPLLAEILKGTPEEFIKRYDKNGDGVLSKDEVPPFLPRDFTLADSDGNGKLDRAEVAAMLQRARVAFAQGGAPGMNPERMFLIAKGLGVVRRCVDRWRQACAAPHPRRLPWAISTNIA